MENLSRLTNPGKLYLIWTLIIFFYCFIIIPYASKGSPDGEQKLFTLLSIALEVALYGYLVIAVLAIFVFKKWFKDHFIINIFFLFLLVAIILLYYFSKL
jgi:hypothetical protein